MTTLESTTTHEKTAPYDAPRTDPLNSNKSSDTLRQDIRTTRSHMDQTLDALADRLNPKAMIDELLDSFRDGSGGEIKQRVTDTIRNNPLPAAMAGAGLVWLMLSDRDAPGPGRRLVERAGEWRHASGGRDETDTQYFELLLIDDEDDLTLLDEVYPEYRRYHEFRQELEAYNGEDDSAQAEETRSRFTQAKDQAKAGASAAGRRARQAGGKLADVYDRAVRGLSHAAEGGAHGSSRVAAGVGHSASAAAHGVSHAASYTGEHLASSARSAAHGVAQGVRKTREAAGQSTRRTPLSVGLATLAAGVMVGLSLPSSRKEDRWFGEFADDLKDRASDAAHTAKDRAVAAASHTASDTMHAAQERGLDPASIVDKAEHVFKAGMDAAAESARDEGLTPAQLKSDAKQVAKDAGHSAEKETKSAMHD